MAKPTKKPDKLIRVGVPKGASIQDDKALAALKKKGVVPTMAQC